MSKLGFSSFSVCYFLCVVWNTGVSQVTWVYYAEDCQHIPYRLHGDSDIYTAVKTPVSYDYPSSEWGEHRKRKTEQRLHKKHWNWRYFWMKPSSLIPSSKAPGFLLSLSSTTWESWNSVRNATRHPAALLDLGWCQWETPGSSPWSQPPMATWLRNGLWKHLTGNKEWQFSGSFNPGNVLICFFEFAKLSKHTFVSKP